jgi:hypothetical protein
MQSGPFRDMCPAVCLLPHMCVCVSTSSDDGCRRQMRGDALIPQMQHIPFTTTFISHFPNVNGRETSNKCFTSGWILRTYPLFLGCLDNQVKNSSIRPCLARFCKLVVPNRSPCPLKSMPMTHLLSVPEDLTRT